jgi:hypothetical protein
MLADALGSLQETAATNFSLFTSGQRLHFDWLQSVSFQLQMYADSPKPVIPQPAPSAERQSLPEEDRRPEITRPTRSLPSSRKHDFPRVRFSKEAGDAPRCGAELPSAQPCAFSEKFPLVFDEVGIPPEYEMSDDGGSLWSGVRDEEVYQANPFEIHGKIVPLWARREAVARELQNQRRMNGDAIFRTLPKACPLELIFAA